MGDLPTHKRKTKPEESYWIIRPEAWGAEHEILELGRTYEKRDAAKQEIALREQKIQRKANRQK